MIWISLDLDYITGDCRDPDDNYACIELCCNSEAGVGRGALCALPDSHARFMAIREFIFHQPVTDVIVRDNHGDIIKWLESEDIVYNYDWHDDEGECTDGVVRCGNWVTAFRKAGGTVIQMGHGTPIDLDQECRLFIAISRPYTTNVVDKELFMLLMDLQVPVDLYGGREEGRPYVVDGNTMIRLLGQREAARCSCGANVFSLLSNGKYECHGCGAWYECE